MMIKKSPGRAVLQASLFLVVLAIGLKDVKGEHFLNEWAAHISGGRTVADQVAKRHGYYVLNDLRGLDDHYVLKRRDVPHRSKRSAQHHTQKLEHDPRVLFVEQQQAKVRVKRDGSALPEELGASRWNRDVARERVTRGNGVDDPNYSKEWYLNPNSDQHVQRRSGSVTDLRVKEVWMKGFTGKGVVCTILDDGIESNHTDLIANYDPRASYDVNDDDHDPFPRYDVTNENKHGTRCAGEIAMAVNNENCGVGVAFDSRIGGIRLLDGTVSDRTEATSISYNRDYIDIYSASWGPNDDGKTTEKPGTLVASALKEGVTKGRGGKGSIFAWASGNGGRLGDNCNMDGYASSIYTLSISSATQFGNSPWYAEKCSSTLATTYSSGANNEMKVVSADLHNKCTENHSGTSAAAPMAAGIFALLLQANPDLTWRDVQHITIHSARMEPLRLEKGWYRNGAGYCVNLAFGFGLMDALSMVELADKSEWEPVGAQHKCTVEPREGSQFPTQLSSGNFVEVELTTSRCEGQKNEINFLEHVELVLDMSYQHRGALYAELESPSGTITSLIQERRYDMSSKGFVEWPLMSVHTWGENPTGTWKFRVADRNTNKNLTGELTGVKLILLGTKEMPKYRQLHPKKCSMEVNADAPKASVQVPVQANKEQQPSELLHSALSLLHETPELQDHHDVQKKLQSYLQELDQKAQYSAMEEYMAGFV